MATSFAERVLAGLGPTFRDKAGDLLPGLVEALASGIDHADKMIQPADPDATSWVRWWPAAFDLDATPDPAWLGNTLGTKIPGGLTIDDARTYVAGRANWRRGTRDALLAALRANLDGTQHVEITERDGSPWRLSVAVYAAEVATSETALEAALASQKPVGIIATLTIRPGASYQHMIDDHGPTYADFTAAFPRYSGASTHVPEP